MNDIRIAVRQLLKNPGFTLVAAMTLGLGLGANAMILGMINLFFFEPLDAKDAERLVVVMQQTRIVEFPHGFSWRDYQALRERVGAFEDALAVQLSPANLSAAGRSPDRTWIEYVSGNYFTMLGVPAALGRTLVAGEGERPGADPVVVLSHPYWKRQFGSDAGMVGRSIVLNGQSVTVIGVMPERFEGAQWSTAPSAWVPASMLGQYTPDGSRVLENRDAPAFKMVARLKPGSTAGMAQTSTEAVVRQLEQEFPRTHQASKVVVIPEMRSRPEPSFSQFMPFAAAVFMGLVLLVLLIACANVANLMFSRALARQREMGIRAALGATRWLLIRQLLVEGALLGLLGCVVGSVLAHGFGALISSIAYSGDIPIRQEDSWNWRPFLATALLSVIAGVLTGWVPALRATQRDVQSVLKTGTTPDVGSGRHWFRNALVVGQTALCVAVLVCGALFVQSLRQVARQDLGFKPENVLTASLDLGLQRYQEQDAQRLLRRLQEELSQLPGVSSVAIGSHVPFDYGMRLSDVGAEGKVAVDPRSADGWVSAGFCAVSSDYLKTLGTELKQGRDFEVKDETSDRRVVLVNQTLAQRLWPGEDAVGKRLRFGRGEDVREVVGVVKNGKYFLLNEAPRPFVYTLFSQHYMAPVTLHLRVNARPLDQTPNVRRVLTSLDPNLPLYSVRTLEEHLRQSALALMPLRMAARLSGVQGLLGLCLAVMGIYGVVSFAVGQRTREIGIRMALGAQRRDVLQLVVREGRRLTWIGLGAGLGLAVLLALGLSRLLYGLNPMNLPVFTVVLFVLGSVAWLACYLPARRALRVDPVVALRNE